MSDFSRAMEHAKQLAHPAIIAALTELQQITSKHSESKQAAAVKAAKEGV